ncbi:MAG TPA: ABC transporter permease [Streptosporangiaceae bacterium]|jgi:ABC-type antimicrobial peptide transport system permease subunit|nr:ABC transporter permease [Streptosporangiaceae bacterium]
MFLTYLRRELRRRMRQAIIVAVGLALGIGLVIVVTSVSSGVKNAQASVLHSLYGEGTDITVTKTPTAGSGGTGSFGFRGSTGTRTQPAAGTTIDVDTLRGTGFGSIASTSVTTVSRLKGVAAAAGGLTLTDTKITGKIPAINSSGSGSGSGTGGFGGAGGGTGGGGGFSGSFTPTSFTVDGVDIGTGELGPLSSGKLSSGRTFASSDDNSNVAVLDSNYATQNKLKVGSTITIAKTSFKVIGIVTTPSGQSSTDSYIPLARAQALASMKNDVNTIYVSSTSASNVSTVSKEISTAVAKSTVTNSSDLANEVTGSLASTSSLANNLGKWLAIAVLIAAFLLASLLTMSAVSRRVREFGTLKALGWRSRRIIWQVMGESVAVGIIGGIVGVALGLAGTQLVDKLAPSLKASVGSSTTGTATPGGARQFTAGGTGTGTGGFGGGGTGGTGTGRGGFGGGFRRTTPAAAHTVAVHLTAPVTIGIIVLAVVLAIAGGVIAGSFGGWRAARLRPAAALAKVA